VKFVTHPSSPTMFGTNRYRGPGCSTICGVPAKPNCWRLEEFPVHVIALWMGHDAKVSLKHYAQTTEDHFDRATRGAESGALAAQNRAQHSTVGNRTESQTWPENEDGEAFYASQCESLRNTAQVFSREGGIRTRDPPWIGSS
jgi:hypothetical protein